MALWSSVTPDYFRAIGIPLLKGRFLTDRDSQGAPQVAVISKSLARQLAPNADPVGKRINVDGVKGVVEIVGVVDDVHQRGMTSQATSEIYLPFSQAPTWIICFAIRTATDPTGLAKPVERAIWAVDKDQSIGYIMPMSVLASESMAPQRVTMLLLGAFASMALILAAVGIYGVIAYSAGQRTHEIGIRRALGAQRRDVLELVLSEGLVLVLTGIVIGLAGALGLTRVIAGLLYSVGPRDPAVFTLVPLLLAAVALFASYLPARRATKVDPMVALRYE
jgi:putative ABC transport system permease protein